MQNLRPELGLFQIPDGGFFTVFRFPTLHNIHR